MTTRNNTRRERAAAKRALAAVLALTLACSLSPAPSLANDGSALNFDSDASASIEGSAPISGPVEGFDSVAVEGEEHDFASAENAALDPIPVFAPDEALASGSDGASDPDSVPVESAPDLVDSIPAPRAGANYREVLAQTAAYLSASVPDPGVSSIGGEWAVIGLARNDSLPADYAASYYSNLVRTLRDAGGVLHRVKYTEYSRVAIALSSLGFDPTDVAGYDVLSPLGDFDQVCWQGANGPIWALIALDSRGYDAPTAPEGKRQTTRDALVAYERLLSGKTSLFDMSDIASAVPPDIPPDPDPAPDPAPTPSGQPSGGAGAQDGNVAPSGKTLFAAQAAAPFGEKMIATSSLSPHGASSEDGLDADTSSALDAASAPSDQPGQDSSADAAAASDNASSPWLWAGIAVVAACALAALGVYRARLARKDDQAEADQ